MRIEIPIFSALDPTVKLYTRGSVPLAQVGAGAGYVCTADPTGSANRYFDPGALADGDYEIISISPSAIYRLRIAAGVAKVGDQWPDLDSIEALDPAAIAAGVFQRLRGSSLVSQLPVVGDILRVVHNADWTATIPIAVDVGDKIVLSIGPKLGIPVLVANSIDGLVSINSDTAAKPSDHASISRVDASTVAIYVRADALNLLRVKQWSFEIRTLQGTATKSRFDGVLELVATAGSEVA